MATYFGMPNFGNFLSRKMATYFGMPNFGKKNGNLFFGMPNFGNLTLARKMATYFGIPNFGNLTLVYLIYRGTRSGEESGLWGRSGPK